MKKQITYFDPRVIENNPNGQAITVAVATQAEFDAVMSVITNPEREIPQDSIHIEDLPPVIDPQEQLRADVDFLLILGGVE